MATSLRTSKSAMSSSDSFTPKTHPYRIKQRVASYHTTEVMPIERQKVVAMATSLSTAGPLSKYGLLNLAETTRRK